MGKIKISSIIRMILRTDKTTYISRLTACCFTTLSLLIGSSCSSDINKGEEPVDASGPILVNASMAGYLYSRSDGETDEVNTGEYCLSYPMANSDKYNTGLVQFNVPGIASSIGVVTVPPASELKWSNVLNVDHPTFYLDNIPLAQSSSGNPDIVEFSDSYNPFIANPYDPDGSNDLLWGSKSPAKNSKTIDFDLHHNMARLKVKITVDKTNEAEYGDLDIKDATVVITSLLTTPKSYNRLDGNLTLVDSPAPLTLVSPDDEDLSWASYETDVNNPKITVYTTKDFVLPPQGLKEDTSRPELVITLKNGATYSGILPYAMEVVDSEHPDPYPMTLYFLKEHILTISTLITEEPPQLEFMPVQVVNWVYKGTFSFDGHQSGIYNADEFGKLISSYNAGNIARLDRYGALVQLEGSDSSIWIFQFWNSVVLDYNEIHGKLIDNKDLPFTFNFNNFSISVQMANGTLRNVNAEDLIKIIKGTMSLS